MKIPEKTKTYFLPKTSSVIVMMDPIDPPNNITSVSLISFIYLRSQNRQYSLAREVKNTSDRKLPEHASCSVQLVKSFCYWIYLFRVLFDDDWQENLGKMNMYARVNPWKPINKKDKQKMIKEMDLEVMILIGAIAFLGLVLLLVIFCLCLYFYKERKEAK